MTAYELHTEETSLGATVLVHAITGFLDAGAAGRIAMGHLLSALEHEPVVTFDIDPLFDYRARRPRMTFLSDHYASADMPRLVLERAIDAAGTPFLVLHGPEPDLGWQGFLLAVERLVERFGIERVVGMHAVPWPAPHTRPLGVTAHASDPDVVAGRPTWVGALEVPGHLGGLLELYLGERGHLAMGFAAHVPHYLVQTEYPRASVTLLEEVSAATGLALPLDRLREAAAKADTEIAAQIEQSPENATAITALEAQYDAIVESRGTAGAGPLIGEAIPTGDEIAEQVEQFLAQMDNGDNPA